MDSNICYFHTKTWSTKIRSIASPYDFSIVRFGKEYYKVVNVVISHDKEIAYFDIYVNHLPNYDVWKGNGKNVWSV